MAYYLYKKIRDHQKRSAEENLFNTPIPDSRRNEAPITGIQDNVEGVEKSSNELNNIRVSKDEARAMRKYRWRLIAGLVLPATVQGLNMTMIAGALPFIASDFHQFSQLNWIITAYNLTSAAFIPAWGSFADIFGRYITLQVATLFMILGSALCAGAPITNFPMLLAGRGLQGVGSSGLIILEKIILADKVSLKENAKNNTVFTLLGGIGFGIGPTVGGYLTTVSWRWCFIVNIPLAAASLVLAHFVMRPVLLGPQDIKGDSCVSSSEPFSKRLATVDFGGELLFLFGMGLFVLAITWAGAYYPWSDAKVVAPLVIGSVLLMAFLIWEYSLLPGRWLATRLPHQRAMIPLKLLWTRNAGLLMYIDFITGMAMYAVFYFVDLYFTIVKQFDSGDAGTGLIYYMPGLAVGAYTAMFVCNSWPRKTWPPLAFGTLVEALGITLLAVTLRWGHLPSVYGMLALTGVGTGVRLMPGTLHGVGYYRRKIASIVSLTNLAISLGGTLASTIMLNIFNNKMSNAGISLVHGESSSASSFSQIAQLPEGQQEYLRRKAKAGIITAFYGISAFMWLGLVSIAFLGNVDIKRDAKDIDTYEDGETDVGSLTEGSYLGSFLRRRETSGETT